MTNWFLALNSSLQHGVSYLSCIENHVWFFWHEGILIYSSIVCTIYPCFLGQFIYSVCVPYCSRMSELYSFFRLYIAISASSRNDRGHSRCYRRSQDFYLDWLPIVKILVYFADEVSYPFFIFAFYLSLFSFRYTIHSVLLELPSHEQLSSQPISCHSHSCQSPRTISRYHKPG